MENEREQWYIVRKANGEEDGAGEQWSLDVAKDHVARCEFDQHGIGYEILPVPEEEDSDSENQVQSTKSNRKRSGGSKESS